MTWRPLPTLYIEHERVQSKQHMAYLGVINRCGQTKSTICSIQGPYQVVWSNDWSVYCQFWHHDSTVHLHCKMPRYWGLVIFVWTTTTTTDDRLIALPLAQCARGNNYRHQNLEDVPNLIPLRNLIFSQACSRYCGSPTTLCNQPVMCMCWQLSIQILTSWCLHA